MLTTAQVAQQPRTTDKVTMMTTQQPAQGEHVLGLTDDAMYAWLGDDGVELDLRQHTAESLEKLARFARIARNPAMPNWGYATPRDYTEPTCPSCGEPCGTEPRGHVEC